MNRANGKTAISPGGSNRRGAGILMHITSLPSSFGVGDIGPSAFEFADFLAASGQKYWQMLPLNPTGLAQGYSPYSSTASMAAHPMLISIDALKKKGLLTAKDLQQGRLSDAGRANFKAVEQFRDRLLHKAFLSAHPQSDPAFAAFVRSQGSWLRDFALFTLLKRQHHDLPWFKWAKPYKLRNVDAVQRLEKVNHDFVTEVIWQQYVFHTQWSELRTFCRERKISLIGDIPFYAAYDSSDVWANQEIFAVDQHGKMKFVAGVPPDYFNSDGQLWGMPVFDWKALYDSGYSWWIDRLRKNIEMFDIVRLDHFRAFAAFWQVKAGDKNARKGTWVKGPGDDFFQTIQRHFPSLPFIAEDLGDIDDAVHNLRESYDLPGMKVLQFAFDDPARSSYSPHNHAENFIVYTGTHDNNTTRGWFRKDANANQKRSLSEYTGRKITEKNVHLEMMRLAYASVSRIAMIPMQDVLGLDEKSRMNTPASVTNNWMWRMRDEELNNKLAERLMSAARIYNRI